MTAASHTDIANRALIAVAARATITDFELENSPEAKLMRALFEPTRDALLRAANWNFSTKTAYLSLLRSAPGTPENPDNSSTVWDPDTMPPPPWLYEYLYPSDCIRMRYIPAGIWAGNTAAQIFPYGSYTPNMPGPNNAVRFEVRTSTDSNGDQANTIVTNADRALAVYTKRVENSALWDPSFQEAMVFSLAVRVCLQVNGSSEMLAQVKANAKSLVEAARANDGNEGLSKLDHTPDWIRARGPGAVPMSAPFILPWLDPFFLV